MTGLTSNMDTIDRVLAECDARNLPPLGLTCLRRTCTNSVMRWLNPYFCSESCRATATVADFTQQHLAAAKATLEEAMVALTLGAEPNPLASLGLTVAQATSSAGLLAGLGYSIEDSGAAPQPDQPETVATRGWLDRWIRRIR